MQTIILAGGEGTRLRPLTAETPKPLIKILGEPTIVRLLNRLNKSGIRSATVCTHYLADRLKDELGASCRGVRLKYCREEVPLGTAGCVRAAWNGDDVLVLSGDSVCGFDLRAISEHHKNTGADVTIVAREVDDPREYGLITIEKEGKITGFLEKPGYDDCLTNLANTGAYIISKEVIARIPEGENVDFAKDVFPALLKEGKHLSAFIDRSYWYDIGDIPSLLRCQRELSEHEGRDRTVDPTAVLGEGTVTSAGTVVEENAAIGANSRVLASLICEGASIAADADISEAVVGRNVTAGEGLIMKRFSALGDGCVVGSGVTVEEGARVAPRTRLPDGAIVRTDITGAGFSTLDFGDNGEARGLAGTEDILRFGEAVGSALGLSRIALGGVGTGIEAVSLGLRAAGVTVYHLGGASFGETVFCARKLDCTHFIFVGEDIRLCPSSTLSLERAEERKIEQFYCRGAVAERALAADLDGSAVSDLYIRRLRTLLPKEPKINASLRTENAREAEIFAALLPEGEGERVTFTIASDRRTVTALTEEQVIPYENLLILGCKAYFSRGKSVVLPPRAPLSCDNLAAKCRSSVIRAASGSRPLTPFACDPIELIFELICYVTEQGMSLAAAADELPRVVYTKRIIEAPEGLPKIMREGFSGARAGSDVMVESGGARAFVRPLKSGRAVSLYIESVSQEAASELSADILKRLGR